MIVAAIQIPSNTDGRLKSALLRRLYATVEEITGNQSPYFPVTIQVVDTNIVNGSLLPEAAEALKGIDPEYPTCPDCLFGMIRWPSGWKCNNCSRILPA